MFITNRRRAKVIASKRDEPITNWHFCFIQQKPAPATVTIFYSGITLQHNRMGPIAAVAILLPTLNTSQWMYINFNTSLQNIV